MFRRLRNKPRKPNVSFLQFEDKPDTSSSSSSYSSTSYRNPSNTSDKKPSTSRKRCNRELVESALTPQVNADAKMEYLKIEYLN